MGPTSEVRAPAEVLLVGDDEQHARVRFPQGGREQRAGSIGEVGAEDHGGGAVRRPYLVGARGIGGAHHLEAGLEEVPRQDLASWTVSLGE
jgi:hypothetical protein